MLPQTRPWELAFFVQLALPIKILKIEIIQITPGIYESEMLVVLSKIAKIKKEININLEKVKQKVYTRDLYSKD